MFCFGGISESVEHILNELEDLFQSLVRRMNKSEMEDFELVNWFKKIISLQLDADFPPCKHLRTPPV